MSLTTEELQRLASIFGTAPAPHPKSGEEIPPVVYADPGRHGFYYRAKKPNSVAAFVRGDFIADLARQRIAADRMADAAEWFAKNFAGPRGAELVEAIAAFREACK